MTEQEGRELASIPKRGEPATWDQSRPYTLCNKFGVVDDTGIVIEKVHVELLVYISPEGELPKYVLSLYKTEHGRPFRAYQLHINPRPHIKPGDHTYSHEHFGLPGCRIEADPSWSKCSFERAVEIFCERCNLTLTDNLPDYEGFELR